MIKDFKSKAAEHIYNSTRSRESRRIPKELHRKIVRLFDQLNAASKIETLKKPPGNRLEKLGGDLKEYWSIRVNDQWRVIFKWKNNDAHNVDVVDYH